MRNPFATTVSDGLWTEVPKHSGFFRRYVLGQPLGALGFALIVAGFAVSLLAPLIAPYDPLTTDYGNAVAAPSLSHWLGTDSFGRDLFSRILYGGRTAFLIGVSASFVGCTIGLFVGIASAYIGGWVEMIIERFLEILLAIPITVLALVLVSSLGRNLVYGIDLNLILAIALPIIPKMARVARSQALTIRSQSYIDAAVTLGFSDLRIIFRHMAPNITGPYLVLLTAFISQAILIEASLSYLGLGVTEPTPSWGLMLAGNAFNTAMTAPWIVIFPGVAIAVVVFAFSMFGDALRDALDPKARADR
ncbi:ABC transporter permease [Pararhizobium sp. BT-229]|uniref:ABC transporter permease n=1 Tax=Pararhizobium sp. BT-229 TaxID=2986923 RepID=UPI0021F729DF|nr:ABC transporter permease [Pararhizobium sp. BT-229]MCV9967620.1 ABC transporter permease [Pararhizobium sp. BT-229]